MSHLTLRISLAAAVSLGAVSTSFAQAAPQSPPPPPPSAAPAPQSGASAEATELEKIAKSAAGPERTKALRDFVAKKPKEELAAAAQFLLARALVDAAAPSAEVAEAAKLALKMMPSGDEDLLQYRVELAYSTASLLIERGERLDVAREIVKSAIDSIPDEPRAKPLKHTLELVTASVSSAEGKGDEALAIINRIVAEDPDDQTALVALGAEHQKAGRLDEAIDALVRAETVFQGEEVDGTRLREVYRKKHGSLDGLDAQLAQARNASIKRVALDARRSEGAAPTWQLTDLAGKTVKLSDLKGQVVVLDFWATWCPPCRAELPGFEELSKENAGKGVTFVAVNVEGAPEKEIWEKRVRSYVEQNKFTFTVVNDFEGQTNAAYKIEYLPTVVVIDKTGAIRYRNDGFEPGVKKILQAQVDSLLK